MRVDVAFTAPAESPGDRTCLVIDVLRATSVMAVLLSRGVRAIYPAASIEGGRWRLAELVPTLGRESIVLIGEENALPPQGYDHGNSPTEFEGLTLPEHAVAATTNGTPALLACAQAPVVMPAAPVYASAVLQRALAAGRDILVVCAGLRGMYADDDTMAAGLFVDRLRAAGFTPGAEAERAFDLYDRVRGDLAEAFRKTEHGARLVELGFDHDLQLCASIDRYDGAAALGFQDNRAIIRPFDH